ncbi:hypothetical protein J2S40_003355 [Nocardioides luteus]|uniref:Uncharacterized protein n=1 Tax=Nocardioides luteus TaxID=1844 RepID=A0ABQ5SY97_9ACTN|nr:hypothetical protein [Nocardioides luteus]MDR7312297.1 hypothetical protein [Nocardioides luteus]GGR57524.1 hypothetical protein GCM10010197_25210 [Nocardioides luteus]GLJ68543.1 hypothetical protein GCM10017579_25790 [Nocardioides luteus]
MSYVHDPHTAQQLAAEHRDREIAACQAGHRVEIARQARRQEKFAQQIARQAEIYEQIPQPQPAVEWLPKPRHQHTDSIFVLVRRIGEAVRHLVGRDGRTPGVQAR